MLCCEPGNSEKGELEDRLRAKRRLRRRARGTKPVAGAPRRAHVPELAPRETLRIGVDTTAPQMGYLSSFYLQYPSPYRSQPSTGRTLERRIRLLSQSIGALTVYLMIGGT